MKLRKRKFSSHPMYCRSGVRGGSVRYSPGVPSAPTQIVDYSSSYYTVFHSVIYNSVAQILFHRPFENNSCFCSLVRKSICL